MANIREIVLNILMEYDKDKAGKMSLLKDSLEKYDYLETRDKAFIKRVVDGCLERQTQIDYCLDQFSKVKVQKMQPLIRSLMRMGTYQIMFMDQVPDSAACNEAVKLADKHKFSGLKGFVNGVLRNISRNKENIKYPDKAIDNGCEYLSVFYSTPKWLCEMWVSEYGYDRTESILEFFLQARPTTIRLNVPKLMEMNKASDLDASVDAYVKELNEAGAVAKRNPILNYAIDLEKTDNIRFLPGFDEGLFTVQDVSSMLVTEVADPKEGQTVIDVCAAPGGKTLHAAERVGVEGRVISRDLSDRKCDIIRENAERLGLSNIEVEAFDARIHDGNLEDMADILYLDVPCSGLGIIGRKSDIKLNTTKKGLKELSDLQWEIVKAAYDYVRPGGILMYSTCTVNKAENEAMIDRICKELPFDRVDITDALPARIDKKSSKEGYIQLLPGEFETDGFFIAKLLRRKEK